MGGRGSSSGMQKSAQLSPLQAFKENAKQFNFALQKAKENKASIVEYTDITGKTARRYWNGATFVNRKSALYEKERQGTYKAKFKMPE